MITLISTWPIWAQCLVMLAMLTFAFVLMLPYLRRIGRR